MMHNFVLGDLIRYGDGPTSLMRLTCISGDRCYGRAFHSSGTCTNRHISDCKHACDEDRARWAEAHDESDQWIRGKW
jgi:hypothetical protein